MKLDSKLGKTRVYIFYWNQFVFERALVNSYFESKLGTIQIVLIYGMGIIVNFLI